MWSAAALKTERDDMKKIDMIYNPYTEKAGLTIDGSWHYGGDGRPKDSLVGKSIEKWLPRRTVSYQRWDGILPELMEYLNDDELLIRFCGTEPDYRRVEKELKKQERTVKENGFDAGLYRLSFREQWQPEKISRLVLQFIDNRIPFVPVQKEMMELQYLSNQLKDAGKDGMTAERLRGVRKQLLDITEEIVLACEKKEYSHYRQTWENARREAEQIFS